MYAFDERMGNAMAESLLREEVDVCSEKYDIHGTVRDYGMVTKLFFTYEGKEIVMGIHRNILKSENYEDLGRCMIGDICPEVP